MDAVLGKNLICRVAVGDIPRRAAGRMPDKEALVEYRGGARNCLTFDQFNRDCNRFARGIRGLGLSKGDSVATICLNSSELAISMFGLAKGGFVSVPVNPGLDPGEMAYVINHSRAGVLIVDDLFVPSLTNHLDKLPHIKHCISLPVSAGQVSEPFIDFYRFIDDNDSSDLEDVIIEDRDIAQIMYTSGTTAMPKGVAISNLNIYFTALQNTIDLQFNSKDIITAFMPLFHCAQHILLASSLVVCAKVVIMRGFEPENLLNMIQNEKITFISALPAMYRGILGHPNIDNYDLSSLEICLYGMTPMDKRTLSDARKKTNATFYLPAGQTEAYPGTNLFNPDWFPGKEGNVWGRSMPGYDTAVMDDAGNLLPVGEVGEIVWRGPGVMEGYFKDEAATEQAWKFGWHHSGDQGYMDEDGMLVFIDRKKDMIKTGGENVPSVRVEAVILAHPKVADVAVIGLPHRRWMEAVTAVVTPKKDSELEEEELIRWCKHELGGFQVPKAIICTNDMPRTSTGKIKKNELRKQFSSYYDNLP